MRANLIYSKFLAYLKSCGGCAGKRNSELCKYAVVCAVAETLGKKGLVGNSEELLHFGERKEEVTK